MKKELLIVGIICLFIGVSIQPAFAIDISNVSPSENVEDCGCEENNRINPVRVNYLLKRLEFGTKILMSRYGHIPEVKEKGEELLDVISSNEQSDEPWFPILCELSTALVVMVMSLLDLSDQIIDELLANVGIIMAILLLIPFSVYYYSLFFLVALPLAFAADIFCI